MSTTPDVDAIYGNEEFTNSVSHLKWLGETYREDKVVMEKGIKDYIKWLGETYR